MIGSWWVFALAAGVGSVARFILDRAVQAEVRSAFPWGTWVVNVSGCLVLGVLVGVARRHGVSDDAVRALGTGGLGAFTTFSTVNVQVVTLASAEAGGVASRYLASTIVAGAAAAAVGVSIAEIL
jgi:fluoride exporter